MANSEREHGLENTYDIALPITHSYLGTDLEELRGRTLFDDGSQHTIPILYQPGVVLLPGQTLPLAMFEQHIIGLLRKCVATDHIFGVLCAKYTEAGRLADVGTTAEIYEYMDDQRMFRMKAKGRQRFRVLEIHGSAYGSRVCTAVVKILPEVILPNVLSKVKMATLDRYRLNPTSLRRKCNATSDAIVSPWPHWVYDQYNLEQLADKVKQKFKHLQLGVQPVLPVDPVELSYSVAQCLPLHDLQRLELIRLNSAVQRLRWELNFLNKQHILICRDCSAMVGSQKDVFCMSVEGPQGTYVNQGGYVHETITLYKVSGVQVLPEEPSTEYTWFPGYAWTVAVCCNCSRHMGWKFTATRQDLKPLTFWGLCRRSLCPDVIQSIQSRIDSIEFDNQSENNVVM